MMEKGLRWDIATIFGSNMEVVPSDHYTLFVDSDLGSVSTPGDTFINDVVRFPAFVNKTRWEQMEEETNLTRKHIERMDTTLIIVSDERRTEKIKL